VAYASLSDALLAAAGPGGALDVAGLQRRGAASEWLFSTLEGLLREGPRGGGDARLARSSLEAKLRHKHLQLEDGGAGGAQAKQAAPAPARPRADAPRQPLLSAREARARGLYTLPAEQARFELLSPLHVLWARHSQAALSSLPQGAPAEDALPRLSMHGAWIRVERSSTPQRCGLEGVVFAHTARALRLLSPTNQVHLLPVAGDAALRVSFSIGGTRLEVDGSALPPPQLRSASAVKRGGARANAPRNRVD